MSAASYNPGNYPVKLNKRESKVVETAMDGSATAFAAADSVVAAAAEAARTSFIEATAADTTTDFGDLEVGDLVVHIPAAAGNSRAGLCAVAATSPFAAVIGDFYLVIKPK